VVTYSEVPSNLVIKKASPKIWLPALTAVWGIITMCLGFVRNFGSFSAVRALLGIAEGGLLPGMVSLSNLCLSGRADSKRYSISHHSTEGAIWLFGLVCSTRLLRYQVHSAVCYPPFQYVPLP
jgi:MFS family permease